MTVRALLLALALAATAAPAARAQPAEPTPASPPPAPHVTLDSILAKTHQALVLDQKQGAYVVVRAGDQLQGFTVTAVDADRVILSAGGNHYILSLPDPKDPAADPKAAAPPTAAPGPVATPVANPANQPLDPYAAALPLDPYAAAAPGPTPGSSPATQPTPAPALILGPAPAPTPAPVSAPPATEPSVPALDLPTLADVTHQRVHLPRAEFDGALDDFTTLAQEIQLARHGDRVRVVGVSRGSFPYRLGLRAGDEIASIAGAHVADLDAAAGVYARLKSTDRFTVELYRGHRRIAIDVRLTR